MQTLRRWATCIQHRATKEDSDNEPPARPRSEEWVAKREDIRSVKSRRRTPPDLNKPLPVIPISSLRSSVGPGEGLHGRAFASLQAMIEDLHRLRAATVPLPESHDGSSKQTSVAEAPEETASIGSDSRERGVEDTVVTDENMDFQTPGPMRMGSVSDGAKDYAALLMTREFCEQVQKCVELQRQLGIEERARIARRPVDESFLRKLKARVTRAEQSCADTIETRAAGKAPVTQSEPVELQAEVTQARSLLDDAETRHAAAEAALLQHADESKECQSRVIQLLEEAFVQARMLELGERPVSAIKGLNLSARSGRFRGGSKRPDRATPPSERPKSTDQHQSEPTTQPETPTVAQQSYHVAQERFREAEKDLKQYDGLRTREKAAIELAQRNGQPTPDRVFEEFKQRWEERYQTTVGRFNEAKEALQVATIQAKEAGVQVESEERHLALRPSSK